MDSQRFCSPPGVVSLVGDDGRIHGSRTGWVVDLDAGGTPRVDFDGNPADHPVPALCGAFVDDAALAEAVRSRQGALLLFEEGDPGRPVLVTLLRSRERQPYLVSRRVNTRGSGPLEARVDGRRVVIEAEDELELRCGEARILLRRNGRLLLEGYQVDSRSRGLQRLKGGKVEIN
ncbi:DUF6484 domain-containing protein [Myxococcus sp. RHSTA-1-4]|uniref:DUF6484 domain-containing protein n=1 Tax=Myxococcus sp. RHSTA-1-4 TaxID=2874601 RepID=UPI001CBCCEAC|nr:DUF6484 domain-containing protein [Myxococcus sp. RHSTA-1-4]MBZ4417924.1 DUF6484 domain-containing protein [Myxococcus sp. RHSTA-1-4]